MNIKSLLAALVVFLSLATPASAEPFEDGLAAYHGGDYETALRLMRPLAEQGYAKVQYNLGVLYEKGQGVPQDYKEAMKWFRLAAEQDNASGDAPS